MPSDIQDFIGTFIGLKQLQNQTEQVAQRAREESINGVNVFMQLARQSANPGELALLADRFAELGVGSRDQLLGLLPNITPTEEAIKAQQTQYGIHIAQGDQSGTDAARSLATDTANSQLTGQSTTQRKVGERQRAALDATPSGSPLGQYLDTAFTSQTLGGVTPGKATVDALLMGLPTPELVQSAGIQAGTRLSAAENASLQTGQAGNRLGWAQLAAQSAYQTGELEVQSLGEKAQMLAAMAKAKGLDPSHVTQLITAKTQLLKAITDSKNKNPTDVELSSYVGGLNAVNQQLAALGLPHEPPIAGGAAALKGPTVTEMIKGWFK